MSKDGRHGTLELLVNGLGLLIFSPGAVAGFERGVDYFDSYLDAFDRHLRDGSIVGVNTGEIRARIHVHLAPRDPDRTYERVLPLGIRVTGGRLCFAGAYDLYDWNPTVADDPSIPVSDGLYALTIACPDTRPWLSGQRHMEIDLFLTPVTTLPHVDVEELPFLAG